MKGWIELTPDRFVVPVSTIIIAVTLSCLCAFLHSQVVAAVKKASLARNASAKTAFVTRPAPRNTSAGPFPIGRHRNKGGAQ